MATGIRRIVESNYFKTVVLADLEKRTPIDARKVKDEIKGIHHPMPAGGFSRGVVEELRLHPLVSNPTTSWGLWDKPVVLLHNSRGGVEYQEEQKKYFGSVSLDLNNPATVDGQPNSWENYIARANQVGLPWTYWWHCHTHDNVAKLLNKTPRGKTCAINLEDVVTDGISIPQVASLIDSYLGTDAIVAIPTLGWIQNLDWSALSRHVFLLEFFLNDPPPEWQGIPDVDLARQFQEHALQYGCKKVAFLCGIYDASESNPGARTLTSDQYLTILREAGVKFGGIYLGDNNGSNYAQWV